MPPRFIPTVEQFRPFRHHQASDSRSNGGVLASIAGRTARFARYRQRARCR